MRLVMLMLCVLGGFVVNAQVFVSKSAPIVRLDQREVSNKDWSAFIQFMKNDPGFSKQYIQSMLPDQWTTTSITPKNEDSKVVGVSWYQAMAYCKWRSVIATYLDGHTKTGTYQQMQADNKLAKTVVTYRLPTEKEWNILAANSTTSTGKSTPGIGFRCVYVIQKNV